MNRSTIVIATSLLLSTVTTIVQAQTMELLLDCKGKITADKTEYPVPNMVVVVNLTKKTVTGFNGIVANINSVDDTTIFFQGEDHHLSSDDSLADFYMTGDINRITGVTSVVITVYGNEEARSSSSYFELHCASTGR
jgi:hypothetical protein